jgi:hypothetical protein
MSTDRPIFLVGCPRSGTTLLSAMLHAHPNIAMPPETRFLIPVYRHRNRYGDLSAPANRRRLALRMTSRGSKFADLGVPRRRVVRAVVAAPPTFGSAAAAVWREYARSRGKRRWGEKRPAYWRDLDVIVRLFPDAQIVHLMRDGRACVASLKAMAWWRSGVLGAMTTWALADRELRRAGRRLGPGRYHYLRYEDLVADTESVLRELCRFLDEPFDLRMLDHAAAARDMVPGRKRWHARTSAEVDAARVESWRTELTPDEIGLFESVAGRALRANGYQLSGAGHRPTARARAGYYRAYAHARASMYKDRAVDARLRRRDRRPLAAR